jgi:predicted O-methyltransferase YrrM
MDGIIKILKKYNIDGFEFPGGTDKNTLHSYVQIYEELFEQFKHKKGNLLEIGVRFGGSSLLWHDYLPEFNLYLIDNENIIDQKIIGNLSCSRYNLYIKNAYSKKTVKALSGDCLDKFDIIIDDGPHTLESHIFVIENYFNLLKENGILIIEDVIYENLQELNESLPKKYQDKVVIYDNRHVKNRYDDIIWTIKK